MKAAGRALVVPGKIPGRGRELCELGRRAGLHGKIRKDRRNTNRRAIAADIKAG